MKRHHLTKFESESRLFSPERITLKQRRDVLASEERLQLKKVITPTVLDLLTLHSAVCFRSCFCIQEEFEYPVLQNGSSKVPTYTKSHVPISFAKKGNKRKVVCQSRLLSRQIFVLSSYQALKIGDFKIGWCKN